MELAELIQEAPHRPATSGLRARTQVLVLVTAFITLLAVIGFIGWGLWNATAMKQGTAGVCRGIIFIERCSNVPLSTFEDATGLRFPEGTIVAASSSNGNLFNQYIASGTLQLPGASFPISTSTLMKGAPAWTPALPETAAAAYDTLKNGGYTRIGWKTFKHDRHYYGWIVEGTAPNHHITVILGVSS